MLDNQVDSSSVAHPPVELSILIPCLNESQTLAICIEKAKRFLKDHAVVGEIIVGDNGSTDGSQEVARKHGARVAHAPERGYGAAILAAAGEARGTYLIMGDADDTYDFYDLGPFLERLRSGYEFVMGNRFTGTIMPNAMPWQNRHFGTPVISGLGRLLSGSRCGDFNSGQRGLRTESFRRLGLRANGMEFASEMIIRASQAGLKTAEVPITLYASARPGPGHLRPWRDGARHLWCLLSLAPKGILALLAASLLLLGIPFFDLPSLSISLPTWQSFAVHAAIAGVVVSLVWWLPNFSFPPLLQAKRREI